MIRQRVSAAGAARFTRGMEAASAGGVDADGTGGRVLPCCWWLARCAGLPTFRLANLSAFRLVGKLGSWRAQGGREEGRGASAQEGMRGRVITECAGLGGGGRGGEYRVEKRRQPARVDGAGGAVWWSLPPGKEAASASDRNNTGRRGAGGEIQGVSPGGLGRPAPDVGLVVYPKGKTAGAR